MLLLTRACVLCEATLVLFSVFAPNNLHPLSLSSLLFVRYPVVRFDTAPSGFVLIFVKRTIRAHMWQVEIICMEPDGPSVVFPG